MNLKLFFYFLLLGIPVMGYAQSRQLTIKLEDSATLKPLSDVIVKLENTRCLNYTKANGECSFDLECLDADSISILLALPGEWKRYYILAALSYNASFTIFISKGQWQYQKKEDY